MNLNIIVDKSFDEGHLFCAADICESTGEVERAYELRKAAIVYRERKDPKGAVVLRKQMSIYESESK